jgi:signal transduction histidine kinase
MTTARSHASSTMPWHLGFALVLGVTAILVAAGDDSPGRRATGLGILGVFGAFYWFVGRPIIDAPDSRRGFLLYLGPSLLLMASMLAVTPLAFVLLWVLFPQIFIVAPRFRWAAGGAATLSIIWVTAAARWEHHRFSGQAWRTGLVQGSVGLVFALAMGWWITRIVEESSERAELIDELHRTRVELATAERDAGVLLERQRFAGEIHDTLAQGFTSIVMLLQVAESELSRDPDAVRRLLASAQRTARENLAEARALVSDALPVALQTASLSDAVGRLAARCAEETGIEVTVVLEGTPRSLPPNEEVALLRAAQEALSNVRKHARAAHAHVVLRYGSDVTAVVVVDDGAGFDTAAVTDGFGLRGLHTRLEQVGGSASVSSRPGRGTTVEVSVP